MSDSHFDFTQYYSGSALFANITLQRISIKRRFLFLSAANVTFDGLRVDGLQGTGVTPFCLCERNSELTFRRTELRTFRSREQGMMHFTASKFTFAQSVLSSFNVTFAVAVRAEVWMTGSLVEGGGSLLMDGDSKTKATAGFLDCTDCRVFISNSIFHNVSGTSGGVLFAHSTVAMVNFSDFVDCVATENGGGVATESSTLAVYESSFTHCSATRGAGVYFDCHHSSDCSANLTNVAFRFNSALEGAGFKWTFVRPTLTNIVAANNTAVYGALEASIADHMVLASGDDSMDGVAGVLIPAPIQVAFRDFINQTVTTDNSSYAELRSDALVGTVYLSASSGVANFSAIIVRASPGTSLQVDAFSHTINSTGGQATYSFTYSARPCVAGEISSEVGCYPCPKNTFSVDPFEDDCRACPSYAVCPGGSQLILSSGYWRASELSSNVHLCPIKRACKGGQASMCGRGYEGQLCSSCSDGFYMAGLAYCVECESLPAQVTRLCIYLAVCVTVLVLIVRSSVSSQPSVNSIAVVTTLKILFTFVQSILMLSMITVDWREVMMGFFSASEMFASVAVASLTLECFHGDTHTGHRLKAVYLNAIAAGIAPLVAVAVTLAVLWAVSAKRKVSYMGESAFQASLVLMYMFHPYIVKATITLVVCKRIEGGAFWLNADSTIACWEGEHIKFLYSLFTPMMIVFIIGIPGLLFTTVTRLRKSSKKRLVAFFLCGFSHSRGYWELVIVARKTALLVLFGLLGSTDPLFQVLVGLFLPYLLLVWHLRVYPYVRLSHNRLEAISLFLLVTLGGCSFYFLSDLRITEGVLLAISLCAMIAAIAFILSSLALLLRITLKRNIVKNTPQEMHAEESQPSMLSNPANTPNSCSQIELIIDSTAKSL